MIETKFYFKNENGEETESIKTYQPETTEIVPSIELIVTDFKNHLKNCGYSDELINEYIHLTFPKND